jgi:hypothetical protein
MSTIPDPGTPVPGVDLHQHSGREVLVGGRWLHLLWADPGDNGLLLRVRTAQQGRLYLVRGNSYQVRGVTRPMTYAWQPGGRELLTTLLAEVDEYLARGDIEAAADALARLSSHAERCTLELRAACEASNELWSNETPTNLTATIGESQ